MNKKLKILAFPLIFCLTNCKRDSDDLDIKNYIDYWEVNKTFDTYNKSSLEIDTIENTYKIVNGSNEVLIVTLEKNPIYKKGEELTDLHSTKSLIIELDNSDNIVTSQIPSKSKIFRKIIAFSPQHGIKKLNNKEKIKFIRKGKNSWLIDSEIDDFIFKGKLNFNENQTLTETSKCY